MRKKVRRDGSGHLGRLHRINKKKFDWAVAPVRVAQVSFVYDDVFSPFLGALQEFGQKTAAKRKQSFHFFPFGPGFIALVPSEAIVSMYLLTVCPAVECETLG